MNTHPNARLGFAGRVRLVERLLAGEGPRAVAATSGVSVRTAYKWLARYRAEGAAGLHDRSSRPHRSPAATPAPLVRRIEALRRSRATSPQIARALGLPVATVVVVLRRLGLSRLPPLHAPPPTPVVRYERARPGELLHVDTKRLGRIAVVGHRITGDRAVRGPRGRTGYEYLHVAVDDASRLAYTELLPDERGVASAGFVQRAAAWLAAQGVRVERVMTDNAFAYRSHAYRDALVALGARHLRTRPYTPRTNGKAERFIQTCLREWAYAVAYPTSAHRALALPGFLRYYNTARPHTALGHQPPLSRLSR